MVIAINSRSGQDLKPYTLEHIANQGFDQTYQLPVIELLAYNSSGSSVDRVQVDTSGNLKVNVSSGGALYAEDSVAVSGDMGSFALGVANEAQATLAGDGDYVAQAVDTKGNRMTVGSIASGSTDSGNPVKVGGKYNSTVPTFTDGKRGDLQVGTRGSLHTELWVTDSASPVGTTVTPADALSLTSFNALRSDNILRGYNGSNMDILRSGAQSNVAAATGFLNNLPVLQYNSSAPTITDTRYNNAQADISGNLNVNLRTLISGEDQTNNRILTMPKYTYSAVALADTQIKATPGILHSVTISCNDAAPTAGSIIIYDNTAESGTQVFNHTFTTTPFVPFTINLDYNMLTGIYVGMTTTADVNFSCAYL